MYQSPSMKGRESALGDIYNPSIHRLNLTLLALTGKQPKLGKINFIRIVNDDLKRIIRSQHAGSAAAKRIAKAAMHSYEPVLNTMLQYFINVKDGEDYFTYMRRRGVNWGRIHPAKNHYSQKRARALNTRLRAKLVYPHKEDKVTLFFDIKKTYIYVGRLYAAFDIVSYPKYFKFVPEEYMEKLKALVDAPQNYTEDQVDAIFKDIQKALGIKTTGRLWDLIKGQEALTGFFS